MSKKSMGISLPTELLERTDRYAAAEERDRSYIIAKALEHFLACPAIHAGHSNIRNHAEANSPDREAESRLASARG